MERSGEGHVVDDGARSRADDAMERYADGDESAFATLYDEVAPRLLRFTARQLRSVAAAEDVVQQAFLQIHLARGQFTRGAAVLPWAYAIARRLVIDLTRRRGHEELRPMAGDAAAPSPAAGADDALDAKRSEASLGQDLLRLPRAQREAFEIVKLEGLSIAESAEVLGITQGMVKIRAHRATVALRAAHQRRERVFAIVDGGARSAARAEDEKEIPHDAP